MLINVRISELQGNTNNSLPLALIIGISTYYFLHKTLPSTDLDVTDNEFVDTITLNDFEENLYVTSNI
jgi:hypothetical protein